uniref:Scaffolding anchor of CK1 domain-containing protein n=1 Tax=Sinocyclocheilus rhinocerous TaxID=307959 RepID=A0A673IU87_9TELE
MLPIYRPTSKPEFFYSEKQRQALETLIHEGRDAYEDYIKTHNIRCFLSDLELERILSTVEVYSPGSPDHTAELLLGDSDGEEISLQYWPDRSDRSIPQLDIGWPDRPSYRGVTRYCLYQVLVFSLIPVPLQVIAIVMDLFTDIDIFKDLLDASYKRKVSVYIIEFLFVLNVFFHPHINQTLRSIRGAEFFSRFSKRVCGSQSQKFMFIDGDKAVSGSYYKSKCFHYFQFHMVCLQTGQKPHHGSHCAKNSTSKNQTEVIKQMKETPVVPPVHPGLLNLEKANMINYVPTWPDPDPPSDVIGFINIRDSNKPLQAHLMRSELFEVSQAIRFKDPFHEAKESLSLRACPGPISQTPSSPEAPAQKQTSGEAQKNFDQNQHQRSSRSKNLISP